MKRTFLLIISFCLLFNSYIPVEAKTPNTLATTSAYTEYINDDLYAEVELCITSENNNTSKVKASTKQKIASKTYNIKNSSGTIIGSYTLTGTFQYNGSSSACTEASYSTNVFNSDCYFNSASASKSGNTATGSFTFVNSLAGTRIIKTLTLTCSPDGTIR